MAAEGYTSVRITKETHQRLESYLDRIKRRAAKRPTAYRPALSRGKIGLGDAIDELLWTIEREEVRKASYGKKAEGWKKKEEKRLDALLKARMLEEGCPNVT